MNTTNLGRKDFVEIDGYLTYDHQLTTDGHLIIEAGSGIEAGEGIEAGWGIKAGWGIISMYNGLRAKVVSCLRIAVGFHAKSEQLIEAKIEKGDVLLGKVSKPNPLPPLEYYWHIHHEKLVEQTYEPIKNRIKYIKEEKPTHEVETRLRLLQKVEDQTALKKAINTNNHDEVDKLHKKECKNCPWDGHTIFPKTKGVKN